MSALLMVLALSASVVRAEAAENSKDNAGVYDVDTSLHGQELTLRPSSLRLRLINLIPKDGVKYEVRVIERMRIEPELDLSNFFGAAGSTANKSDCQQEADVIRATLYDAKSERAVRDAMKAAPSELPSCSDAERKNLLEAFKTATSYDIGHVLDLEDGREVSVEVIRDGTTVSTYVFRTPGSSWLVSYGFTFVRNKDENYHLDSLTDPAGSFAITRDRGSTGYDFTPSVFFARRTETQHTHAWCFDCRIVPAFGIGTDLEDVSIFLGLGFLYGDNIMVTLGGALAQQDRLKGKYTPGQVVQDNLSEDQLVEGTWKGTFYLGITLRLNSESLNAVRGDKKASADPPAN